MLVFSVTASTWAAPSDHLTAAERQVARTKTSFRTLLIESLAERDRCGVAPPDAFINKTQKLLTYFGLISVLSLSRFHRRNLAESETSVLTVC